MRSMITMQLDMQHREEIAALVPQERAHVSELMSKGTIEALYMSANRTSFWMLMPSVFCFWVASAIILIGPAYLEFFAQRRRSVLIFNQSRQNIEKANQGSKNIPARAGQGAAGANAPVPAAAPR